MDDAIWGDRKVWITSFWGWSPPTWGCVGFTPPQRRDAVRKLTDDPFIMVVYVTKTAEGGPDELRGKVAGFYIVSHQEGLRDEFTDPEHFNRNPTRWQNSFKALRAFSFLPEYRPDIDELFPEPGYLKNQARTIAKDGMPLPDRLVEKLRKLPVDRKSVV